MHAIGKISHLRILSFTHNASLITHHFFGGRTQSLPLPALQRTATAANKR
jgi:hypothetical protein